MSELTNTAQEQKKNEGGQAIGRSRGGLSTKIHALVDALGNPTQFVLTGGQVHDLDGADILVPQLESDALLADKAYDAEDRVLALLAKAGKKAVIPQKKNRKKHRSYDKSLYQSSASNRKLLCKIETVQSNSNEIRQACAELLEWNLSSCRYHLA